jgi:hypothetical protein
MTLFILSDGLLKWLLSNRTFTSMGELISDYETGALHPADVKPALAKAINEILQVKFSLHSTLLFFLYVIVL